MKYLAQMCGAVVCLVFWGGGNSLAQSKRTLALEEAISIAQAHSRQLQSDSVAIQIAESKIAQHRNEMLPQFSANLSYIRISDNITPFKVAFPTGEIVLNPQILNQSYNSLQGRQLIWAGGRVKHATQLALLERKAAVFDMEKNKAEVGYVTASLWYNLFSALQSKKVIEANIALLSQQRMDAENFVKQGILLANDLLKVELAVTSLQSGLSDIDNTIRLLQYNLCVVTGLDPKTTIELPEALPGFLQESLSLDHYIESALSKRPELQATAIRAEQAKTVLNLSKGNYLPTVSAAGNYNYDQPNQRLFPNQANFTGTWNIGVFLQWNLTDLYSNKEKVKEARLSALKIEAVKQQLNEGIQMEVNADYNNYQQAKQMILIAQKAVEQATENFRVEQNRFQNSTATATDFLNANTQLVQAKLNLVSASANAELAYKKLLKSTTKY